MASDSCGGRRLVPGREGDVETLRRDGVPKHFLYQIAGTTTAKIQVSHRLTWCREYVPFEISVPNPLGLPSAQQDYFSTVVGHLQE